MKAKQYDNGNQEIGQSTENIGYDMRFRIFFFITSTIIAATL